MHHRSPSPSTSLQAQAGDPTRNLPATSTPPSPPPPAPPCPHCCGEGYLITQGPGYFDLHEECWMPNDDIDPCPTCHGSGRQPNAWDDPMQESDLQPQRNQDPHTSDDLPRLLF